MKVNIFTEGGKVKGMGHIERCKGLYDELKFKDIQPLFIINGDETCIDVLTGYDYFLYNWLENSIKVEEIKLTDYCIVDSYYLTNEKMLEFNNNYLHLLFVDDLNYIHFERGIVVNPAIEAVNIEYKRGYKVKYLLGENYVMLRKPFRREFSSIANKEIKSVLVTLGGSDVLNLTEPITKTINKFYPNLDITVVVGNGATNIEQLKLLSNNNINIFVNVAGEEMAKLMIDSDIIISGAGQTVFEILQTNSISMLIQVIDNQKSNIRYMVDNGFAKELHIECLADNIVDNFKELDYNARIGMKNQMKKINFETGIVNIIDEFLKE